MATSSRGKDEISAPKTYQDMKENSTSYKQRIGARIINEANKPTKAEQKAPVIYYLSRNGQLEHPHFMVVPFSSPQGLYLKDVKSRLTCLRGEGIANMYSWSSKRSYKSGFVWHDLSEDDLIQPCQGHEYVLKGSRIPESPLTFKSLESTGSSFSSSSSSSTAVFSRETNSPGEENPSLASRRKNESCSSFDELREYRVYKTITDDEGLGSKVTNASTQTEEDKARQRKASFEEIGAIDVDPTAENDGREFGRTRASAILMDMIKCGSRKN